MKRHDSTDKPSSDWAAQAVDRIDGAIGVVRDKAVIPITTVARALVYGMLAAVLGTVVLILLAIMAVRILDVYIPGPVWSADLIVGGTFTLVGLLLWTRRSPKRA